MSLGTTPKVEDLYSSSARLCDDSLADTSIFKLLYRFGDEIFADAFFGDLYDNLGRASIPPRVVATVMVLQRLGGLSDREAVDAFSYDIRYKYACGGLCYEYPGFAHTVLVDFRARLAASDNPMRIFTSVLEVVTRANLVKEKRVPDSTPLYDAVTTMESVTLLRRGIRGVYRESISKDSSYQGVARELIEIDGYLEGAKPSIDWEDTAEREALIDRITKDATTILAFFENKPAHPELRDSLVFLATIMGQDIEVIGDRYAIARRVAKDRVISSVDPDARHGRKSSSSRFDGFKAHIAVDPESEIITAAAVRPGNVHNAKVALDLIDGATEAVYADNAYGSGELFNAFTERNIDPRIKARFPIRPGGMIPKSDFVIDHDNLTVTCPAGISIAMRPKKSGGHVASFKKPCIGCPLLERCTKSKSGRSIEIGTHERQIHEARVRFTNPDLQRDYRETRPKVERKLAHLTQRLHGGRKARVRGLAKVSADFLLLAAAHNLARMANLGINPFESPKVAPI